ncbi:HAD domain-containing protein [Chitinophaga sp. YIM B06452]|uniref:HAD domain-containing protein n=1 Tax=Chitinophaga sp. YIM B06452 TaxID=3082158 RepID=UPI0031FEF391
MLIFLDIDGVMVPAKGWKSPEFLNDGFPAFSSKATIALQNLISEGATIMLTTSHKSTFNIETWKDLFQNRGINIENIKSLPANIHNLSRKDEIINWFDLNNFTEDFVIIDDDKSLNELPDFLKAHLIQTSSYVGLTEELLQSVYSKA